jgi:hypothetical protein
MIHVLHNKQFSEKALMNSSGNVKCSSNIDFSNAIDFKGGSVRGVVSLKYLVSREENNTQFHHGY